MAEDKRKGNKQIEAYFECSWKTAWKHLRQIKDVNIFYKTIAGIWVLNVHAYEKKYGAPKKAPA